MEAVTTHITGKVLEKGLRVNISLCGCPVLPRQSSGLCAAF